MSRLTHSPAALVFWVNVYGLRAGDVEELTLTGPDGSVIAARHAASARNRAVWLAFAGRKRAGDEWPAGTYRAQYTVMRGDSTEKSGDALARIDPATALNTCRMVQRERVPLR